jgi:HSP20 family molecular chaperone IbpA
MRNYDLSPLLRQWIGFDKLANALQSTTEQQTFPPYNIEKAMTTTIALPLRWPGSARTIWIFSLKARA